MTVVVLGYETEHFTVGETRLMTLVGGSGRKVLVLHGIEGHEGWLAFHEQLSRERRVLAPSHPGFGHTPAPDWITSIPHQAVFYNWLLQSMGERVDLVGIGIGGWIAAHMAIMCAAPLNRLVLVDAAGLRSREQERMDVFVTPWRDVIAGAFASPSTSAEYQRLYATPIPEYGGIREAGRVMTMRMCYRPYMHDPALEGMLGKIQTPTLVVWGKQDGVVPLECGERYARAIPNAQLRVLDASGHFAHLEQPERLAEVIREFSAGGA